jgi:hypothetical protein
MWSLGARLAALLSVVVTALVMSMGVAQAQTTAQLSIDPVATFDPHTGIVTVTGTYSCGEATGTGLIEVTVQQDVGRVATVTGSGFADVACVPGQTGTWSAEVVPETGEFRGGQAFASAQLRLDGQVLAETGAPIRVRGGGQTP